jgi:hypothetical protein
MLAIPKPFGVWFSAGTTLAGSTSIDGQKTSPGTCSLVRQFCKEPCPSRVVDCFRKHASAQSFHVQVFDKNGSVFIHHSPRQLVLKIMTLVEHRSLNLGYDADRVLPTLGKLLATGYSPLRAPKTLLHLLKPARALNFRPVAQSSKRGQAHINTHSPVIRR